MFLSTIAAVIGIGTGIKNLVGGNKNAPGGGGTTDQAQAAADPFGPLRSLYGQELGKQYGDLQRFDPNDVTRDPEYQFQLEQGLGAINKGAAASGMLGSGTRMMDLQKYGQGLASSFADRSYNRKASLLQMLGQFSGATTGSPAAASNAIMNGANSAYSQQNSGLNSIASGLNGVGPLIKVIGGFLGGGGSGGAIGNPNPPDPSNGGDYGPW